MNQTATFEKLRNQTKTAIGKLVKYLSVWNAEKKSIKYKQLLWKNISGVTN